MSNQDTTRAWVEVDLDALRANFQTIRSVSGPGTAIVAMVKGNGYGLGAERIVRALDPLEPWAFGVATADEGIALRRAGIQRRILVCGPLPPDAVEAAAEARLTASISELGALERWAAAAERTPGGLDFHVEIDTGMGRCGFDWREASRWGEAVRARVGPRLRWVGAFTHFHGADSTERTATMVQWERFGDALAQLPVSREDLMIHAANSAATLRFPECRADLVRPGIYLYGGDPAPALPRPEYPAPKPVASVRSRIVLIRDVPPGTTVGYGALYVARRWERWGTLGIGYGDGLRRNLTSRASVLVHGKRVPVVGRISMDLTVVDLTDVPEAQVGDVATLIGRDGRETITVDEVAAWADTISYEVLTGLTARLPRVERANGIVD